MFGAQQAPSLHTSEGSYWGGSKARVRCRDGGGEGARGRGALSYGGVGERGRWAGGGRDAMPN